MELRVHLAFDRETKNTYRFEATDPTAAVKTLYVEKRAFPVSFAFDQGIQLTLEVEE